MSDGPVWFAPAILAGGLAALSYVLRMVVEAWRTRNAETARRAGKLVELASLLAASKAVFKTQRAQADRLAKLIAERQPALVRGDGLERLFTRAFDTMTNEERELHTIIRASSEHALRELNASIIKWLRDDIVFKVGFRDSDSWPLLATKLNQLEAHLITWLAKYEAWIPGHPEHALVYVADEQQHGVGFPTDLDVLVRGQVQKLRPRVRLETVSPDAAQSAP